MSRPKVKFYERFETETHKIVILVDVETNGKRYAEAIVTPKNKGT